MHWRRFGDAVARLLEAREFLDVQVQQLTGMLPLVAPDRRGRFEGVEPVKPRPAQDSADGGGRDPHGPGNLYPRQALETQRRDAGDNANRCGPGLSMRPRTSVGHAIGALGLIPGDPLAWTATSAFALSRGRRTRVGSTATLCGPGITNSGHPPKKPKVRTCDTVQSGRVCVQVASAKV